MFAYAANKVRVARSINPTTVSSNGATNGTGVDISEFEGAFLIHCTAPVASSGDTITFTVEESEDNVSFAAVAAANLINPDTGAADTFTVATSAVAVDESLAVRRENVERYIRVVATVAGDGTPTASFCAHVVGVQKYS